MRNSQLNAIYNHDQDNSVSPFFSEDSYFLHRMSELWGEELWEEVNLEKSDFLTTKQQQTPASLCYLSA
ncbi:MAG: hypothetical protein AB4041_19535 [Microcystaceae cyanobacterium]